MAVQLGSIDHLAQVISQAVAPAFLLGAVVGFITIIFAPTSSVVERMRSLSAQPYDGDGAWIPGDLPRLRRRVRLLHWATLSAICSGATVTILIITAFAFALLGKQHIWGSAALFIISLMFFCVSLAVMAADVVVALHENER
jgi:hypothetical protein